MSSPFNPNRLALAPVAMIIASAVFGSGSSDQYLNGREERSTRETVSVTTRVPKRIDWSRNLSMSSGPRIPVGKPGKFSTRKGKGMWIERLVIWRVGGREIGTKNVFFFSHHRSSLSIDRQQQNHWLRNPRREPGPNLPVQDRSQLCVLQDQTQWWPIPPVSDF